MSSTPKKPAFDAIVANPPFSYRWEPTEAMGDDVRFKNHGLAPKSAADFAFLLHGFHFLKDEGVMAIILPHGVLFRGGAEVGEAEIDLDATHGELVEIEKAIAAAKDKHNGFLKELGLNLLP